VVVVVMVVADLTDFFFALVDINGDACIEWEEFVMLKHPRHGGEGRSRS